MDYIMKTYGFLKYFWLVTWGIVHSDMVRHIAPGHQLRDVVLVNLDPPVTVGHVLMRYIWYVGQGEVNLEMIRYPVVIIRHLLITVLAVVLNLSIADGQT